MNLGEMIRLYRASERITMRDLADRIGISASTVCRIENGKQCDMRSLGKLIAWLFS